MGYFPRITEPYQRRISDSDWEGIGPPAFRKVSFSLLDMVLVTGIILRLGRAVVVANAGAGGLVVMTGFLLSALFLLVMTVAHLGNFPLRHWTWRAPAFALGVAAVESMVSLFLIMLGREPYGTGRATYADWWPMALTTVSWRFIAVGVFAIALAAVVQWTRVKAARRAQPSQ